MVSQEISLSVMPTLNLGTPALREVKPRHAGQLEPVAAEAGMRHDARSWPMPHAAHVL